jgi:hypothetical protein
MEIWRWGDGEEGNKQTVTFIAFSGCWRIAHERKDQTWILAPLSQMLDD